MTATLEELVLDAAGFIKPAERLNVAQAAAKHRQLNNPGAYIGPWLNEMTPYSVEPMEVLTSLEHRGMILAGPARSGKSDLVLNFLTHTALYNPMDMLVVHMTQATARDWSKVDLARFFRHTKEVGALLKPGRQSDNTHDKEFKSGMVVQIKWPTITELSGKTIPYVWFVDYDRIKPESVDKEGLAYDLGKKRTQTYGRYGMTVAESSPGWTVEDQRWIASTPHEAPPTQGILGLYNRGDRRRWYWKCPKCSESFEPDFSNLRWPSAEEFSDVVEGVVMLCPHCGFHIPHKAKGELNSGGRWVRDGQVWRADGSITGSPTFPRAEIASFWLKGPASAFMSWEEMVEKYHAAKKQYDQTGDESALIATTTLDQGLPYSPQAKGDERLPEDLMSRATDWGGSKEEPVVPEEVRFLIATVDVQGGTAKRFVVQVHGFGVGGDCAFVDMFTIRKSERIDADGEHEPLDPASYPEDWDVLVKQVVEKTYLLNDGSGRRMAVKMVGVDSGGEAGVTTNAYNFWRRLKAGEHGHHKRVRLMKGDPHRSAPRHRETYPDSNRKDRHAGARGDVPVVFIGVTLMKDQANARLGRTEPGGGLTRFPHWAENWLYTQLTSETRTDKGWENPRRYRNEAWDLFVYALTLCLHPTIRAEFIDWDDPPAWAAHWDDNALVLPPDAKPFAEKPVSKYDLTKLAADLA